MYFFEISKLHLSIKSNFYLKSYMYTGKYLIWKRILSKKFYYRPEADADYDKKRKFFINGNITSEPCGILIKL